MMPRFKKLRWLHESKDEIVVDKSFKINSDTELRWFLVILYIICPSKDTVPRKVFIYEQTFDSFYLEANRLDIDSLFETYNFSLYMEKINDKNS